MLQDSRTLCSGREDGGGIYTDVGPGQLSGDENAKTHDSQALVVWRGWFVYSVRAMGVEPPRRAALAEFGVQLLLLALAWVLPSLCAVTRPTNPTSPPNNNWWGLFRRQKSNSSISIGPVRSHIKPLLSVAASPAKSSSLELATFLGRLER